MKEHRLALLLCIGVFGSLIVLAMVFFLERMTNLDMAFQTFLILKSQNVAIQSGRFGAAVTQFWPWAAQALGLPLKAVLMAYSLGHVLWPTFLAIWCWRIGQWRWALAIGMVATLLTTHSFYWLSEMPQGLVFLCAIFAWMHAKGSLTAFRWWQGPLWLAALWTAFYFHPLILYALTFLSLFFSLDQEKPRKWVMLHLSALGVFVGLAILKYKVLKLDWYDAVAIKRQEAFGKLWPNWLDLESNWKFLEWTMTDYWLLWIVVLANFGYFIRKQLWAKALLVSCWPLGFVLLVNVPFYEAVGQQFYMENLYLPLAVFASIPLIFEVFRGQNSNFPLTRNGVILLGIIFAINLLRITYAHHPWTERMQWEQDFLTKTSAGPQRKILLSEKIVPMDKLKMSWGSPYEFLMLSSLEHPDSARCILISDAPERYDTLLTRRNLFLGTFKNYPLDEIPGTYFNVRDTSGYVRW